MKFTRNGSVHFLAGAIAGVGVVIAACGGDDSTDLTTDPDAGGASSSGGSSSGSASDGGGDGAATSSSGGSSGTSSGGDGGGAKAAGEGPCTGDGDCKTGVCFISGKDSYCTIKCTKIGETDPVCTALGAKFSGGCNKKGYCEAN
jgi:hypothetical protein